MTRVLDRLGEKYDIDMNDRAAARAAALLHDVGHGSFSHVMEKVLGFHHESWTVPSGPQRGNRDWPVITLPLTRVARKGGGDH